MRHTPRTSSGRWLLGLTLSELNSAEAYAGLREIASSEVPADLKDNDLRGSQRANESAIRQSSVAGLDPPRPRRESFGRERPAESRSSIRRRKTTRSGRWRSRAISAAGRDYEARVQRLKRGFRANITMS